MFLAFKDPNHFIKNCVHKIERDYEVVCFPFHDCTRKLKGSGTLVMLIINDYVMRKARKCRKPVHILHHSLYSLPKGSPDPSKGLMLSTWLKYHLSISTLVWKAYQILCSMTNMEFVKFDTVPNCQDLWLVLWRHCMHWIRVYFEKSICNRACQFFFQTNISLVGTVHLPFP